MFLCYSEHNQKAINNSIRPEHHLEMAYKFPLALFADPSVISGHAQQLADLLNIPLISDPRGYQVFFNLTPNHLELIAHEENSKKPSSLRVDFTTPGNLRRVKNPHKELLIQAIKIRKKIPATVVDATGGLGRDAFLLAAAGCKVDVFEQNHFIGALLADGLKRAALAPQTARVCNRITLHIQNTVEHIGELCPPPEVVYLDPMFPERDKSAKVKQNLRILRYIEGDQGEDRELFAAVWAIKPRKIVVKRPLKSAPLCEIRPTYTLKGKAVRFDVYIPASFTKDSTPCLNSKC